MDIAFIGLGIMGSRMVANLLKNEVAVTVWNRSKEPVAAAQQLGATAAATAEEAVRNADLVVSMLAKPEVVETLFLGEKGLLQHMKKEALWLDCSTVNPSFSRRVGAEAKAAGVRFADAPVAGSAPQAAAATLQFFVGAEEALVEPVRPYLEKMSQRVLTFKELGKGSAFKMLVNGALAQSMAVFAETIALGEKLGFEQEFLLNTLSNTPVVAGFVQGKIDKMQSGAYDPQFSLELMHKDLHLATLTAYEQGQPLFMAQAAKELYAQAKMQGLGQSDFSAVYEAVR
jgi:3-hydroxyisobutyrate dehydrogenase-like beta-hydroxyacid dehydrogenase